MVFVMVALAAIFFLLADQVMRFVVTLFLNMPGWRQQLAEMNPFVMVAIGVGIGLLLFIGWRARDR